MSIDLGDSYRLKLRNLSPAGDLVSATNMALTITLPDGTLTVVDPVTADSTGVYHYDYATVQAGRHMARWLGTGTGAGAYVETFDVRPVDLPYLVSLDDAKDTLNIDRSNTTYDDELRIYIESATRAAEDHRDEIIAKRSFTHEGWYAGCSSIVLPRVPVISVTSVVNLDTNTTMDTSNFHVRNSTGKVSILRGGNFVGFLQITYVAGYQVVPAAFSLAVRLIIQHLWETQRGQMGASRFAGGLDDAALMRFRSMTIFVPPRAQELLGERMPMI